MADKRHDALIPLTHDHHHGLAQARQLRLATGGSEAELFQAARSFVDFFRDDTIEHFREEEELVFPLAVNEPEAEPLLARVMVEHLRIHALVADLESQIQSGSVSAPTALRVAEALQAHIRLEEKEVFPLLERLVGEALTHVVLPPRSR